MKAFISESWASVTVTSTTFYWLKVPPTLKRSSMGSHLLKGKKIIKELVDIF